MYMRALSFRQPWASLIVSGQKTIEWRSWTTKFRGDLLVCSTVRGDARYYWYLESIKDKAEKEEAKRKMPLGFAVGIVTIASVRTFLSSDRNAAWWADGEKLPDSPGFAWVLKNPREIEPFPVKGKMSFFNVDYEYDPLL